MYYSDQGKQYYFKDGELGDPKRMYVDGVGSLYRMKEYNGTWCENVSAFISYRNISNSLNLDIVKLLSCR